MKKTLIACIAIAATSGAYAQTKWDLSTVWPDGNWKVALD